MTNPIIKLGRIEMDPTKVPVAASMQPEEFERFEQLLQDSVRDEADEAELRSTEDSAAEEAALETPDDHAEARTTDECSDERDPVRHDTADDGDIARPTQVRADVTEDLRRDRPEREPLTSNSSEASRASKATNEPLMTAAFHAARGTSQPLDGSAPTSAQTTPSNPRSGEQVIRGAANAQLASNGSPKTQRVQTGYATRNAKSMQLLEQARDSVFKQILMKLTDGGGEMRMRLSPPDLGQLDLRMTVEGGNKLTLMIAAERNDMAQLLQRHIDELKGTLQENGLEVTGAEVQTREDFERQQSAADADDDASATPSLNDIAEDVASAPQQRGYITADGLDFWA